MFQQRAAQAYAQIGLETGVAAGSPHRLILMLYDGAMKCITNAAAHLAAGRIAAKGSAVSKAIAIIDEGLKGNLDLSQGGHIATQLGELYDYMSRRLLSANLRNDPAGFSEVQALLAELREAWAGIETPAHLQRAPNAAVHA
ncbi:MAG: flagellar export chaperone FliS [Casimicrobiaceae bacterium]